MNIAYLFENNSTPFLRNLFYYESDKFKIKIIICRKEKNINMNHQYFDIAGIDKNNIIYLDNDIEKSIDILNKFNIILHSSYNCIANYFNIYVPVEIYEIEKKIDKNILKIYLHHGLDQKNDNHLKIYQNKSEIINRFNYKQLICCNCIYNQMIKCDISPKRILKISGLPQFDHNKKLYSLSTTNKDIIMLFVGERIEEYQTTKNYLIKTIELIQQNFKNKIIYIKFKRLDDLHISKIVNKFNNVKVIDNDDIAGKHLNYYASIITPGGTLYLENLNLNKRTILFQYHKLVKDSPQFKYFRFTDNFKFNKLLICEDFNNFDKCIKNLKDKSYFDKVYDKEISSFNNFSIGNEQIVNFKEEFFDIINNKIIFSKNKCKLI